MEMICLLMSKAVVEKALLLMGQGMLAIFLAMGVVFLTVLALNFFTKRKQKKQKPTVENFQDDGEER